MALARSASAGGLSINTGAANLFGSTSQPAASGGLFGSAAAKPATPTTTTTTTAAGTLFGAPASTPVTTTAPAANMFGAAAATSAPAAGGLFGQSAAATAPKPSLFGAPAAATSAPAAGGLFGGAAAATSAPAAGGLFGGAPAATAAPATGGLFGGAPAASTAAPASGGLFGGGGSAAAPAPASGGMFGASTAGASAAPAAAGGMFGASTAAAPAAASGGLFGNSMARPAAATQQPGQGQGQVVPGVRIDLSNLKGTTRFNDLQEGLQSTIIEIDSKIQSYIEQKNQVEAFLPAHGESLEAIPGDVKFVARKYDGVSAAMASDLQAIQSLRETVKEDAEHAQLSFKALDNQKLPAQFHTSGLWSGPGKKAGGRQDSERERGAATAENGRTDLINYFSDTGDDIGTQLRKMESNLGEIEVHMYSVQAGLLEQLQRITASSGSSSGAGANGDAGNSADSKVAELAAVLRDFEESILTVASVVGSARESMTGLQLGGFLGRR
ncbi:nucleoporin [Ophiostoma piceae UAMH 11346]|uniref:Nucleoporin n=1 Tax=Ophiostoma piceae (strain UAMH 11346) TaxID=1262450 RepID=S3CW32_OPHP1|nr:nucleoporin [Ophiostoma piceae UAMH 11346]